MKAKQMDSSECKNLSHQLGHSGEKQAKTYLLGKKFLILDCNFIWNKFELDLIALDQKTDEIVFIEVKTRSQAYSGNPSQAVSRQKLQRMQKVAWRYLQERNLANDFRFDIISIWPGHLEHFENVTWLG